MTGYITNIEEAALANDFFRKVIYTAPHSQLVLMSLQPKEEIGYEIHQHVDQFIRVEKGQGKVVLEAEETDIADGSAIVIPAGTGHNIINTSETQELKLYTIYSPANHPEGKIHKTKAEAMADESDHV